MSHEHPHHSYAELEAFVAMPWSRLLHQEREAKLAADLGVERSGSWRFFGDVWHFAIPASLLEFKPRHWLCHEESYIRADQPQAKLKGSAKSKKRPFIEANVCQTCWRSVVWQKR